MNPLSIVQSESTPSRRWTVMPMAAIGGFMAYFAMYAFRKPFTAATYPHETLWNTGVDLKTAFVVAQILGYAISKYCGIDVCSRSSSRYCGLVLIGLILAAELSLVLFAVLPVPWKVVAIFLNGIPLGLVWGFIVRYLEGRRSSDLLLAALCCSFVVSSGIVKDIGRWWLTHGVDIYWMPALTGLCFLPLFVLAVGMLHSLPAPDSIDNQQRAERQPMSVEDRWEFVRSQWSVLWPLLIFYTALTAYRDFRDNYAVDMLATLGFANDAAIFSKTELPAGLLVTLALGALILIRDNRLAMVAIYVLMAVGMLLVGTATWLVFGRAISGMTWMMLTGIGVYLTYVPFNAMLFDRLIAIRGGGTAVFGICLADALGYTGSVVAQLYRDVFAGDFDRLTFFQSCSVILPILGLVCLMISGWAMALALWPGRYELRSITKRATADAEVGVTA